MAAGNWRGVVAMDDAAKRARREEEGMTEEKRAAELAATVLLFEAFLASEDAKDAAKMYERFNNQLVILERERIVEGQRRGEYYDVFCGKGLACREREFGAEHAEEVPVRAARDVVADWMEKQRARAYEFLPWLFAEFDEFADKKRAELTPDSRK